jgi:hypothetical protein
MATKNTGEEVVEDVTAEGVEYDAVPAESRIGATNAFKQAVANFIGTQGAVISLHSADPGTSGASEISGGGYSRKTTVWGAATVVSGGANDGRALITGSTQTFNVPGGVAINFYGVWSAGGVFQYGKPLQPGATLTSAGTITITPTHAYGLL